MPLIEQIHYRHHIHSRGVLIRRVNIVVESNKADIVGRKNVINILSDLNVVASETAEVLYNDKIDFSSLCVVKQACNGWSVKVRTGESIVNVSVKNVPALFSDVFGKDQFLR